MKDQISSSNPPPSTDEERGGGLPRIYYEVGEGGGLELYAPLYHFMHLYRKNYIRGSLAQSGLQGGGEFHLPPQQFLPAP